MDKPKSKKQATKGAKQIVEENTATLAFYRNMALISTGVCIITTSALFEFSTKAVLLYIFGSLVFAGCYHFMTYMARPTYSDDGALLDSGVDLNMVGGVGEHIKDLIILTTGCELLSLVSNYFWLLWLLAPGRAFMLLWVNVLGPWFFQQAPPTNPEADEKKQRKMERKMRRVNYR